MLGARHPGDAALLDLAAPLATLSCVVPGAWCDFNGHMTEWRYAQCFSDATERLMEILGADAAYVAGGASFFTAETHIRHLDEAGQGAALSVQTQVLGARAKVVHVLHRLLAGGRLLATGEHLLIHVDLAHRRAATPAPQVARAMARLAAAHAALPRPEPLFITLRRGG